MEIVKRPHYVKIDLGQVTQSKTLSLQYNILEQCFTAHIVYNCSTSSPGSSLWARLEKKDDPGKSCLPRFLEILEHALQWITVALTQISWTSFQNITPGANLGQGHSYSLKRMLQNLQESWRLKTAFARVIFLFHARPEMTLGTRFIIVNNTVQHCYTWLRVDSGSTILDNIVNKYEQCGQHNIVRECYVQYCSKSCVFTRVHASLIITVYFM